MEDVPPVQPKVAVSWQKDGLSRGQVFFLWTLIVVLAGALLGYGIWAARDEAAHNRVKDQRRWELCMQRNTAPVCTVSLKGL